MTKFFKKYSLRDTFPFTYMEAKYIICYWDADTPGKKICEDEVTFTFEGRGRGIY